MLIGTGLSAFIYALQNRPQPTGFSNNLLYVGAALLAVGALEHRLTHIKAGPFEGDLTLPESEAPAALETISEVESGSPEPTEDELLETARFFAGQSAIEKLLTDEYPACGNVEFRLFLPDEDKGRLFAVFAPESAYSTTVGWEFGKGVTGVAYLRGEFVCASGDELHGPTFGLTDEERDRYRDLTAAASIPLVNDSGSVLGTLSATTREPEPLLISSEAQDEMTFLALQVTRVLVDLLRWFTDD